MLVKVTLRKPSDTECVTKPYGQLEGYYDLSSPGINASIYINIIYIYRCELDD